MEKDRKPKQSNNALRYEREKRGWSQSRLAELIGSDTSMISRWECGERNPDHVYQEKLCDLFGKNAEELGFIKSPQLQYTTPSDGLDQGTKITRRQATGEIGAMVGGTLLASSLQLLEESDGLERLLRAVKRPASIDKTTLAHLEAMTRNHWQLYAGFENSVQYRYDMLPGVFGHLRTLTQLLERAQPTAIHERLSSFACETTQLIGEICFDIKDNDAAEKYYNTSIELARETQNHVLLATAFGRKSFLPIYSNDPQEALLFLQEANTQLTHDSSDIIRAWLSAREAEAYANSDNADACFKALDRAAFYLEKAQPGGAPSYAFEGEAVDVHFTHSLLLGYKGACYTRLNQPEAAQAVLREDMISMDPARSIHNAIVLVDLARTYIQQGEIEETCKYASEALGIMIQLRSARVLQRILALRGELEPWKRTEYVRNLDQRIAALPHIM
jgi:transcriptional regulator with XRE-family HTH domain